MAKRTLRRHNHNFDSDEQTNEKYPDEISDVVDDGAGCVETWEAMSKIREESRSSNRRGFIHGVGAVASALSLIGMSNTVAGEAGEPIDPTDMDAERWELEGSERGRLISRAVRSEDIQKIRSELGANPNPTSVFGFSVDEIEGFGVAFERDDVRIMYYESDDLTESGIKVFGARQIGDGFRMVDTETEELLAFRTDRVETMLDQLQHEDKYRDLKHQLENARLREEDGLRIDNRRDDREGVVIPLVEDDDVVGRVIAERLPVELAESARNTGSAAFDIEVEWIDNGVSPFGHVRCVLGVCTDFCSLLCAALPVGGGAGCAAACLRYVGIWPIAVGCGVICWAVGAGVCYPTCVNQTGHDPT